MTPIRSGPKTEELLRGEVHYTRMLVFSNVPIGGRGWVSISVSPYTALTLAAHALRHPLPTYAWSSSRFPGRVEDDPTAVGPPVAWITHDKPPPDPDRRTLTRQPHSFKDLGELDRRITTAISEHTGLPPSEFVPEGMTEDQLVQLAGEQLSKMNEEQARNKEHGG